MFSKMNEDRKKVMADINEKTGGSGSDGIYLGVKYNYFEIITNIASEICRVCVSPIQISGEKRISYLRSDYQIQILKKFS